MSFSAKNKTIHKPFSQGFWKGYEQVSRKDSPKVKAKLFEILGINNQKSFNLYLNGRTIPRADQAQEIESLFASLKIFDVWGAKQ